jgi:hypothetical protein
MPPSPHLLFRGVILVAAPILATVMVGKIGVASVSPDASPSPSPSPRPSASATPRSSKAPADEYFGRLKMSILGLRHEVDALAKRYDERTIADDDLMHDAGFIEDGIDHWRMTYPRDPWLPQTSFHLAELYMKVQTGAARTRAKAMFAYTARYFPASKEGHQSRARLAQGFPPLQPESPLVPSPSPSSSPVPPTLPSPSPIPVPSPSQASPTAPPR